MKNYTIIKADMESDKENIISILLRNNPLTEFPYNSQRFDWKFKQIPYGNALFWLAKFESTNSFVGTISLSPRKLLINGEPIIYGLVGDFAVDKDNRGYGPALKLQREVLSKGSEFGFNYIFTVPNKDARQVLFRAGYKKVGNYKQYVKPLRIEILPKNYLENYLPRYLQSNIILKIIDFFNSIVSKEKRAKDKSGYSIEMPDLFDERFDVLWERASKQFNIIGDRSSKFLDWRYKQSHLRDYKIFCILDDEKELAGYIVYSVKDNICLISDILFLPSNNSIDLLLAKFILYLRAKEIGAIIIRFMGNSIIEKKLKEFNFIPKDIDSIIVYHPHNLPLESYLLNENNWYFSSGDWPV